MRFPHKLLSMSVVHEKGGFTVRRIAVICGLHATSIFMLCYRFCHRCLYHRLYPYDQNGLTVQIPHLDI